MNSTNRKGQAIASLSPWAAQPVLIVEDDPLMRDEIVGLLSDVGYRVHAFAGADQLFAAEPEPAGILILDLRLKGPSGLLLQQKLAGRSDVQIIFISGHAEVEDAVAAMKAGAFEFLVKPFRPQALIDAVGGAFERLGSARAELIHVEAVQASFDSLTETEREIALLLAQGLRNKQVAYISGKAENTVKVHRARVMQKMGVTSLIELSRHLQRIGIGSDAGT
ncbi:MULTISPECIES: response regulator [unclassified Novosphingobium]|uniref:response regulator transcription factor n=1 Tax=unclassified Novosphingobium TaxID=2644732 RepID=UPI00146F15DE|nr:MULTISPECIES: response regulator [unclassified Novosphingobium]NMN03852.1 FixJ family two-component response regulator [Novosphingobium sp. SG919]NMN86158.1 FixJ family two-component response regulator [Novosphingobium sp. SG916]